MKREITECDICGKAYDPATEADEPMHRVGVVDPKPMTPQEEAHLDAELKAITQESRKDATTAQAKAYYTARAAALTGEADKRRRLSADERVDVDLICHTCFLSLRDHVKKKTLKRGR